MVIKKIKSYLQLMRLNKPIGFFLLLWPTLWALWIAADGIPPLPILFVFILGTLIMRSAGCVINDIADRDFDKHVERTKDRPLTSGAVSLREAIILLIALVLLAFILVLFLNLLSIELSCVALLLSIIYPFSKRFIAFPQFILGVAFAWAIPMAFAAVLNTVPAIAWLLFSITVIWAIIYDTEYAMVDRKDDLKIGIKSTAILFGRFDRVWVAALQVLMLVLLGILGFELDSGVFYYGSLMLVMGLMIYQQFLIRERKAALCFKAFLNNHWIGLVIFLGLVFSWGA